MGSIEGRIAVEYFKESAGKKYAFKCHRVGTTVYPVNSLGFHPKFHTFASGGCDGTVCVWDHVAKKKLTTFPKFPTSVARVCFNRTGDRCAVASSYTFEEGEKDGGGDEIYVRECLTGEVRGKVK